MFSHLGQTNVTDRTDQSTTNAAAIRYVHTGIKAVNRCNGILREAYLFEYSVRLCHKVQYLAWADWLW